MRLDAKNWHLSKGCVGYLKPTKRPFIKTFKSNNCCDLVLAVRPGCSFFLFYFSSGWLYWEVVAPRNKNSSRSSLILRLSSTHHRKSYWQGPHSSQSSNFNWEVQVQLGLSLTLCLALVFNEWINPVTCDLVTGQRPTGHTRNDKCKFSSLKTSIKKHCYFRNLSSRGCQSLIV